MNQRGGQRIERDHLLVVVIFAVEIVLSEPALFGQQALTVRASQADAVPFSVGHFEQIAILDMQIARHANGDLFNFTDHHLLVEQTV